MSIRTHAEIATACKDMAWYMRSGAAERLDVDTRNNFLGVLACLEWLAGHEIPNPVAGMLADIRRIRESPECN